MVAMGKFCRNLFSEKLKNILWKIIEDLLELFRIIWNHENYLFIALFRNNFIK